jgi:hypothetical protein
MNLVNVFTPNTEAELDTIVTLLEARDVPCFVYNADRSRSPSMQVRRRNDRTIMVPAERLPEAVLLIDNLRGLRVGCDGFSRLPWLAKLRATIGSLVVGLRRTGR